MNEPNPYATPDATVADSGVSVDVEEAVGNPWFTMWIRPRATIEHVIKTQPEHMILLLAVLGGISQGLDRATGDSLGDHMPLIAVLMSALVGGAVSGVLQLYIGGALLRWTGKWLGGKAEGVKIRAALAWSNVPVVWGLIVWALAIALFQQELFTADMPRTEADPKMLVVLIALGVANFTLAIWSIVLLVKSLGQVQGFSAWKGLANVLLALLVLIVPIAILVGLVVAL